MELFSFLNLVIGLLTFAAFFLWRRFQYWKIRGVPYMAPTFLSKRTRGTGRTMPMKNFQKLAYDEMKGKSPIGGLFLLGDPTAIILDLDLVKSIMVKDFSIFPNRNTYYNEIDDPLSAHMINIEDDEWRSLRSKVTPTFTSGKLKQMFSTVNDIADNLLKTICKESAISGQVEIKEMMSRYTVDVIGNIAFGIECNSLEHKSAEFYQMGIKSFDSLTLFQRILTNRFKNLARKLHIKSIPEDIASFYTNVVMQTIDYREKNPQDARNDFLGLLIQMKNSKSSDSLTFNQIAAQSFVFFMAGFETTSTLMTFTMYELSLNKEIQEKARQDVKRAIQKHGGMTYESISDMKYLDQCINETLRKWPPIPTTARGAKRDYTIPNTNIVIEEGITVLIPVYAIHHDEELYPNPDKYDPERFKPSEIEKRHQFAFIPFGEGPRICIGMRFAVLEAKIGLAKLLTNYEFDLDKTKTSVPLSISASKPILSPKEGIFINVRNL